MNTTNGKRPCNGPWIVMYNVGSRDYFLQNNGKWSPNYHSIGIRPIETKFWDYPGNAYNCIAKLKRTDPELAKANLRVVNQNGILAPARKDSMQRLNGFKVTTTENGHKYTLEELDSLVSSASREGESMDCYMLSKRDVPDIIRQLIDQIRSQDIDIGTALGHSDCVIG